MSHPKRVRSGALLALGAAMSLMLAACANYGPPNAFSVAYSVARSGGAGSADQPRVAAVTPTQIPTPEPAVVQPPVSQASSDQASGAAEELAGTPVELSIPAINLTADVTPMGWELAVSGDTVTTRWAVPLDTLGWAVNSAEAGSQGNVVIIGQQALGSALFRPLALGEVAVGQEVRLLAANGVTHLYRVSEVSPPLPAVGATAEETAQAAAYLAPADTGHLTLVSGWPVDVTTHRLFVVAEYAGRAP